MRQVVVAAFLLVVVVGCDSDGGGRQPTARERGGISAGAIHELRPLLRSRHLRGRVHRILVSRRDAHFAPAEVDPLDANGHQVSETVDIVLVETAGKWTALVDGTDLSSVCVNASPRPVREVLRCR
jgi:hypothetical protein